MIMPFRCTDGLLDEEENHLRNDFHWEWILTAPDPQSARISLAFLWSSWLQTTDETPTQHTLGRALYHTRQIRKEGEGAGAAHIPAVCHSSWSWRDREEKDLVDGLFMWQRASFVQSLWKPSCDRHATWLLSDFCHLVCHLLFFKLL